MEVTARHNLDLVPLMQLSREMGYKDKEGRKLERQLQALEHSLRRKIIIRMGNGPKARKLVDRAFLGRVRNGASEAKLAKLEHRVKHLEEIVAQLQRRLQLEHAEIPSGDLPVDQFEHPGDPR